MLLGLGVKKSRVLAPEVQSSQGSPGLGGEAGTGSLNHTLFGQTGSLTGIAWATITTKPLNGPKPIVRQKACILNRGYLLAVSYVGQSAHRWQAIRYSSYP